MNTGLINTDNFEELLFFSKMDVKTFAKLIGVSMASIYRIKNEKQLPSVSTATKIAKAFDCRINFLLGCDDDYERKFGSGEYCFIDRLTTMLDMRHVSKYKLAKAIPMPESIIYTWLYKGATPALDSVVRIAEYLKCSIDYLLGYDSEIN